MKKLTIYRAIKDYIREYFSISTVHGLNYIAQSRHLLEKIIWVIILTVASYFGVSLSFVSINRYNTNPVVISIERDRFAWTTFLPAVTLCPLRNINQTALELYLDEKKSTNRTALKYFLASLFHANYTNFDQVLDNDEIGPDEYMSAILSIQGRHKTEITVSEQLLDSKQWIYECITEMGVCYSFNSQLAVYNSPQYWLENKWKIRPPTRTVEVHPLDGEVFANVVNITTGFNVYIHGPYEVADLRTKPLYVPDDHFLQVYVTALSMISSEETKKLSFNQRKCRYYFESDLVHSPVYSYVLCRRECRIVLAVKLCGCLPHFYRRRSREITCGIKGLHCLSQYKEQLISLEDLGDECNCAANCEEVNYVVEEMDMRDWFLGTHLQYGIKNFPEMRLKRDIIFGFEDLLVYVGGIMGLFQGSSVLTIVEFVYYFTLRLFWFLVRR